METINKQVDYSIYSQADRLIAKFELPYYIYDGALNDTYFIKTGKRLKFGKIQSRQYMIIYPKFEDCWSNTFWVLLTDSANEFINFVKSYKDDELMQFITDNVL